jgi:hypothetical protein
MPYLFDWMKRKTRLKAFPDLGRYDEEYITLRPGSNHFYWIGIDEIVKGFVFDPKVKKPLHPARVQAHFTEGNLITVDTLHLKRISIGLGKGTVDFAKPVTVMLKDGGMKWNKLLSPKIGVLLEDLYERGDRQRPIYQRIDCTIDGGQSKIEAQ